MMALVWILAAIGANTVIGYMAKLLMDREYRK